MKLKHRFCILLSLCLLCAAGKPVRAAQVSDPEQKQEQESDTYTIRFFSGQQGKILADGQEKEVVIIEAAYHEQVNLGTYTVMLADDSKYYVKGIRESGKDNNSATAKSFKVTCDQDYVVAYGIQGNMVSYRVEYVDESGRELAPSETYYGNIGDRPVVAYVYIAGYHPQAYNLQKTLTENENENVFTFVYAPGEAPGGPVTELEAITTEVDGGTIVLPGGGGGGGAGAGAGGAAAPPPAAADAGAGVEVPDAGTPLEEVPELVDLDEEQVPLANGPSIFGSDATLLGIPLPFILAAGAVLIGGSARYVAVARKKKKKEAESS